MKSTIKILILTMLLSANFFALAADKTPSSSTVKDKIVIVFEDDDKAVETSCNSPTHEHSGEGCIDIR